MKKIRRLSLYKSKKVSVSDEIENDAENSNSPTFIKSSFGHSLKKNFFTKKIRSKSMPEGSSSVSSDTSTLHSTRSPKNKRLTRLSHVEDFPIDIPLHGVSGMDGVISANDTRDSDNTTKINSDYDLIDVSSNNVEHNPEIKSSQNEETNNLNNQIVLTTTFIHTVYHNNLIQEFRRLTQKGWYWGPLSRIEAEEKLHDMEEGSFLVRDSSDERHLLSLSFRSHGRTLHTRIEHCNGKFSLYTNCNIQPYTSVVQLIEDSMRDSQHSGIFCYSHSFLARSPTLPVRLSNPISRFSQVRNLQYLCRFVIRQCTRIDRIQDLPLPNSVRNYLKQSYF